MSTPPVEFVTQADRLSSRARTGAMLGALLLVAAAHLLGMWQGRAPDLLGDGWFLNWDTDSYSRVLRVLQLHETGAWYDTRAPYYNAPYGVDMHWTRPLDVLLYLGGWIGGQFTDFRTALELWGMLLCGPLMQLLLLAVLALATRGLSGAGWFLLAALLLLAQPAVASVFRLGFIDYHGLLVVLQLAIVAILLDRVRAARPSRAHALAAGALAGLGVWVSVESLILLVLPALLAMAALWVHEDDAWLDELEDFTFALGLATAFALVAERPPAGWLAVEYDRISIVHLVMALTGVLALRLLQWLQPETGTTTPLRRLRDGGIVGAIAAGLLLWLFPGLAGHPQQELGPIVELVLDTQIAETPYLAIYEPGTRLVSMLRDLGPLLMVLPYLAYLAVTGTPADRRRLVVYATFLGLMLAYLMFMARALAFVQLCLLLPWVEALHTVFRWLAGACRVRARAARVLLSLGLVPVAFVHAVPHALGATRHAPGPVASKGSCYDDRLFDLLRAARAERPDGTVLAPIWNGPAIAYRSGFDVIGSPYHRNLQGIEDGFTLLWFDPEAPSQRALAQRRGVAYVFVCRSYVEQKQEAVRRSPEALIARLAADAPPAWLRKVELPAGLAGKALLYRADFGR